MTPANGCPVQGGPGSPQLDSHRSYGAYDETSRFLLHAPPHWECQYLWGEQPTIIVF